MSSYLQPMRLLLLLVMKVRVIITINSYQATFRFAIGGEYDVARAILEQKVGFSISIRDRDGNTVLVNGTYNGNDRIIVAILNAGEMHPDINKALYSAVYDNLNVNTISSFIRNGSDVNWTPEDNDPVLVLAIGNNASIETINLLVSKGADITYQVNGEQLLLDYAIENSHTEALELLRSLSIN